MLRQQSSQPQSPPRSRQIVQRSVPLTQRNNIPERRSAARSIADVCFPNASIAESSTADSLIANRFIAKSPIAKRFFATSFFAKSLIAERSEDRQHLPKPPNPAPIHHLKRRPPLPPQPTQRTWIRPRQPPATRCRPIPARPTPARIPDLEQLPALFATKIAGERLRRHYPSAPNAPQLMNSIRHRPIAPSLPPAQCSADGIGGQCESQIGGSSLTRKKRGTRKTAPRPFRFALRRGRMTISHDCFSPNRPPEADAVVSPPCRSASDRGSRGILDGFTEPIARSLWMPTMRRRSP